MQLFYFDQYAGNRNGMHTTDDLVRLAADMIRYEGWKRDNEFRIRRSDKGKPYIEGAPFCISVSHSGKMWVMVESPFPVGVDVQEIGHPNFQAIADRFYQPGEREAVQRGGLVDFIRIWCRKEAYIKLKGATMGEMLEWLDVAPDGAIKAKIEIGGETVYFTECPIESNCICVAASLNEETLCTRKLTII